MKLSLGWIFDHIQQVSLKNIHIADLVAQFSAKVAEIEESYPVEIAYESLAVAQLKKKAADTCMLYCTEWHKEVSLALRKDVEVDEYYVIKKTDGKYEWATLGDFGSAKEGLFPALEVSTEELKGSWKKNIAPDYIWVIDNKAITNRPDMWSHRGFAREIAAVLNAQLVPETHILDSRPIKHYATESQVSTTQTFALSIANDACAKACKRLAGTHISHITPQKSNIFMAQRLARVDSRPIDFIVDCTNYVMLDIGQPMHAFDAAKISSRKLIATCATVGEKIALLDGETIELTANDMVISDGTHALALAGIMGGATTAVSKQTNSLYIESANFDAVTIRQTAARHKKRTESSMRFEKTLDPNQNTAALLRFFKLLDVYQVPYVATESITSLGKLESEKIIEVSHEAIISLIGIQVSSEKISSYLKQLGFGVEVLPGQNQKITYVVTVPTYRATKDVTIAEDIIEEIARFYGYENITPQLPTRQMNPFDTSVVIRTRDIKHHLAFASAMHEVQTYAFFDEEFIKRLAYVPIDTLRLAHPFSQNIQQLVTSLVPNLLKCVWTNSAKEEELRFFELNRVWFAVQDSDPVEKKELAGILYHKKKQVDFYQGKQHIDSLFNALGLSVEWKKPQSPIDPWYVLYQTAELWYKEQLVGVAGIASSQFLQPILEGNAFIFELDADFLLTTKAKQVSFIPLNKYQDVTLDVSAMVPLAITVKQLEQKIIEAEKRIQSAILVDFFQKPEWQDKKSVTMRFVVYDADKTMTKEDIDAVYEAVIASLAQLGAQIR